MKGGTSRSAIRRWFVAVGFVFVLCSASSPAQRVSPDSLCAFFPTHVGDEWQFEWGNYIANPPLHICYMWLRIVSDTVMQNGVKYSLFLKESDKPLYCESSIASGLYRLDSASGNVCRYIDSTHESTVPLWWYAGTRPDTVLGVPTIVVSGGWTGQSLRYGYDFGLVREFVETGWPYRSALLYARINGKEYGTSLHVSDNKTQPGDFQLHQNYPNPFNPSTTIRYGLPSRSHVILTIFNTLGQQVAQLVNGEMKAGFHDVKFDGVGLSSGVYFYRMQAGSHMETKRLLLLR